MDSVLQVCIVQKSPDAEKQNGAKRSFDDTMTRRFTCFYSAAEKRGVSHGVLRAHTAPGSGKMIRQLVVEREEEGGGGIFNAL